MSRKPRKDLTPPFSNKTNDTRLPLRSSDNNLRALPIGNLTEGYKDPFEMDDVDKSIESLEDRVAKLNTRLMLVEEKIRQMTGM